MSHYNATISFFALVFVSVAGQGASRTFVPASGLEADFNGLTPANPIAVYVTNSSSASDCIFASGTGTTKHWCLWDGSAWIAAPGDGTAAQDLYRNITADFGAPQQADDPNDTLVFTSPNSTTTVTMATDDTVEIEVAIPQHFRRFEGTSGAPQQADDNDGVFKFISTNSSVDIKATAGDILDVEVSSGFVPATATALAANGGNCSAGNYPLGVDASGAVESCTADTVGVDEIMEEGSGLTKRAQVNFIGASVTCVDNAGATRTDCTMTDANTNAGTICSGTTTVLDGEGNCDDLDPVYEAELDNSAGLLAALSDEVGAGFSLFNIAPSMVTSLTVDDDFWMGIGASLERIIFDAAGDISIAGANFGIGDTVPNQLLGLLGTNAQISIEESNTEFLRLGVEATAGDMVLGWDDSDDLHLGVFSSPTDTSVVTHVIIEAGGDVGFGLSNPGAKIHVEDTNSAAVDLGRFDNVNVAAGAITRLNLRLAGASGTVSGAAQIEAGKEQEWTSTGSTRDGYIAFRTRLNNVMAEKAKLDSIGNFTLDGTVDGRDVAADGTKLDAIESSATADQTNAEIKTAYEANADTNEFDDAEQSKLAGLEPEHCVEAGSRDASGTGLSLVAGADNVYLWRFARLPYAVTITQFSCGVIENTGTCTTTPQLRLETTSGDVMTGTDTCQLLAASSDMAFTAVTAGGALVATRGLRFDTTNTPTGTCSLSSLSVCYTVD